MRKENKTIQFNQLSRENLYHLILQDMTQIIQIDDLDKEETALYKDSKDIRFKEHKMLFIQLLFDPLLDQQIKMMKNTKYDYLIGLLLFISANKRFNYNYSYFLENIEKYNHVLTDWYNLLDIVIKDICALPLLNPNFRFTLLINDLISFDLSGQSIDHIYVDYSHFNQLFDVRSSNYNYGIFIHSNDGKKCQLVFSGQSNGKGKNSDLFFSFAKFNKILDDGL